MDREFQENGDFPRSKLADFGLSKVVEMESQTFSSGHIVGTGKMEKKNSKIKIKPPLNFDFDFVELQQQQQ